VRNCQGPSRSAFPCPRPWIVRVRSGARSAAKEGRTPPKTAAKSSKIPTQGERRPRRRMEREYSGRPARPFKFCNEIYANTGLMRESPSHSRGSSCDWKEERQGWVLARFAPSASSSDRLPSALRPSTCAVRDCLIAWRHPERPDLEWETHDSKIS
jgi:hypothetical protein